MKALILYMVFVTIGSVIDSVIGVLVEWEFSAALSLIVFLPLFLLNFAVCWLLVVRVMDGPSTKKA